MKDHNSLMNEQQNNEDSPLLNPETGSAPLLNPETGSISSNYGISIRKTITTLAVVTAVLGASLLVFKSTEKGTSSFRSG
jgi:hypothetical protein